jgi:adenylyl cyclase-associated protein
MLTSSTVPSWRLSHSFRAGEAPAVKAYDAYVKACLVPFCQTCDDLDKLGDMGTHLKNAWEGIRTVVVLASRSKAPAEELAVALGPYLTPVQDAVKAIRDLKVHRDYDRHQKSVIEMLACLSWVLHSAPKQLPAPLVKEALGSAEFWSNRIRKDYKGKDDTQIAFCDGLKRVIIGLVEYIEENHKAGLAFNPRGISLAEAGIRLTDEVDAAETPVIKSPVPKRHPTLGTVVPGGNLAGLMDELNKRKSADGISAATGLKHVRGRAGELLT